MSRAAFLDRDGVINQKPDNGYITSWKEMHILPDVASAIVLLNEAGFRVIVVTNQRCVAKGLISHVELENLHQQMCAAVGTQGATIDAVYYCPHDTDACCTCRKPAPGMLLTAAGEHDIELAISWMIGDSEIDVEAGKSAGCRTAGIRRTGGYAATNCDVAGSSLLEAVEKLLAFDASTSATTRSARGEHSTSLSCQGI